KHVGIFHVILAGGVFPFGQNGELPALFLIQQSPENKGAVHARPAKPFYIRVAVYMRQEGAVANQSGLVRMSFHTSEYIIYACLLKLFTIGAKVIPKKAKCQTRNA